MWKIHQVYSMMKTKYVMLVESQVLKLDSNSFVVNAVEARGIVLVVVKRVIGVTIDNYAPLFLVTSSLPNFSSTVLLGLRI
jgi:hypothetical protein